MITDSTLMLIVIFLPAAWALVLCVLKLLGPVSDEWMKSTTLMVTLAECIFSFLLLAWFIEGGVSSRPLSERAKLTAADAHGVYPKDVVGDLVYRRPWIESSTFGIEFYLGADGISLALVALTGLVGLLAMLASMNISKGVQGYCTLYLILLSGIQGVFLALDFFLFYVFFEVMLLPMYFLIGVWGGPRREYSAMKFFLFTLLGSVLVLIAMLACYFSAPSPTFDIMKLQEIGQQTGPGAPFSAKWQQIVFALLFLGFAIKVPVVPFHTWLPDAHVEAPTPISMILAGILLKLGGYGMIRIAYPVCPVGAYLLAPWVAVLAVVCIVYGAFVAMAQVDFKKLVAYSSVSHMGYVVLGLAVLGITSPTGAPSAEYYASGITGAMFQMIAHGISSTGMFFLVGVIYDRAHHRDLNRFGGLMTSMPVYGGLSIVIFFAAIGLPGLCGFFGEFATVLVGYRYNQTLGIIAAFGVVITAAYILWAMQRVFFGTPREHHEMPEIRWWPEMAAILPLVAFAILLGVYPACLLDWMDPDVGHLAARMNDVVIKVQAAASQLPSARDLAGL